MKSQDVVSVSKVSAGLVSAPKATDLGHKPIVLCGVVIWVAESEPESES